jgi:dihydrofolate reductase
MTKVRVHSFAVSLDGFGAGPDQTLDAPMGTGGRRLHEWVFPTRAGRAMFGESGGETGVDDDFVARGFEGIGATIMGRNMFGPVRGEWPDDTWRGWWGDTPPFHHPVFVLTNHPRPAITMEGGTTFHFVGGVDEAMARATDAAVGLDIRLGGGVATLQQFLRARLVDEMHLAVVPVLLGAGERLYDGVGRLDGYECTRLVASGTVAHVCFTRAA